MKQLSGIFFPIILGVVFYGCTPDPVFPDVPTLAFKEFRQPAGSDSLVVVFSFTDGDGNVGVAPTDTTPNMVLEVYAPDATGNFTSLNSLAYPYRIPVLSTREVGLEGDIYITIMNKSLLPRDTLQFNTSLLDQSNNRSNYVRTETVILTH